MPTQPNRDFEMLMMQQRRKHRAQLEADLATLEQNIDNAVEEAAQNVKP